MRELHLIEEVCRAVDEGRDTRASAIAAAQRVTAGTLTAAVNQLEAKGYLERGRDSGGKRPAGEITITVKPELSGQVESRVLEGRKYILIPAGEGVEVNGLAVELEAQPAAAL